MPDLDWSEQAIGDIFRINTASVLPNTFPRSLFYHHSLPAWDECGGPVVEPGVSIESNKTALKVPCVLVSKLNPRKPRVSAVTNIPEDENHCASTEFVCLEPTSDSISLTFWRHFFSHKQFASRLDRIAIGSTNSHKRYGPRELLSFRIVAPSLAEQAVIAETLDTLDTQIQKTEALIAKLEKIKEGLLHDLLTRGVDQNGQLRPTPDQAPERYKESALGLIPKEWELTSLGQVAESMIDGPFGSNLKTSHYVEEAGVQVVRLQNIKTGEYDETYTAFITRAHADRLDKNRVVGGDLLVAALGDEKSKPGRACQYPKHLPPAINKADCFRVRAHPSKATNSFLMHCLNSERSSKQATAKQQGVTLQRVNLSNLRTIVIGLPSIAEQRLIGAQLYAIACKISALKYEEQKLESAKSGLMDDLLTGNVRVTPLLKDAV